VDGLIKEDSCDPVTLLPSQTPSENSRPPILLKLEELPDLLRRLLLLEWTLRIQDIDLIIRDSPLIGSSILGVSGIRTIHVDPGVGERQSRWGDLAENGGSIDSDLGNHLLSEDVDHVDVRIHNRQSRCFPMLGLLLGLPTALPEALTLCQLLVPIDAQTTGLLGLHHEGEQIFLGLAH
jgi:hypothetical protein